ncbi:MAG: hypothetical protein AAF725_07440, partial [Acidobacteriota bacterium]
MKLPIPDLLHVDARLSLDPEAVEELLELSFLGKEAAEGLDRSLSTPSRDGGWDASLFASDLFVHEIVRDTFRVEVDGVHFPVNIAFVQQVLTQPPTDAEGVRFRQDILRELDENPRLLAAAESLYRDTAVLLDMFKSPDHAAQLDIDAYRLDIFRQTKRVVDRMASDFPDASSGLSRLAESGRAIHQSEHYLLLQNLLDYEGRQATLRVDVEIGADGEIHDLRLLNHEENSANPLHVPLWKRLGLRLQAMVAGYRLSRKVLLQRLLQRIYDEVSPSLTPLVQVLGHLEIYLASRGFKNMLESRGYATSLASVEEDAPSSLRSLINPLLLGNGEPAVACDVEVDARRSITMLTGPNSGGKTRLLQALGLAQVLGQSGLYVPAASATLPLVRGLFVSLVETESAHADEGRLGREMMRIKDVFTRVEAPAMVILDELCSGTNPSEGIEIFSVVLRLLDRFDTSAYISTHFLDF